MNKEIIKKIQDKKIAIISLANHGYLNFTKNCIKSLENIGLGNIMKVYCIDDRCYEELSLTYDNCSLIESEYNKKIGGLEVYPKSKNKTKSSYKDIVFMKFPAISDALKNNDYVLFLDSDVVFLSIKFIDYLTRNIKDNDVLFQTETDGHREDEPCSGLMYIRSNEKTLNFYNPTIVSNDLQYKNNVGDQDYVRENKDKLKHNYMDVRLFPNGRYFMQKREINPYVIHYNWCRPKQKIKIMSQTGGWFW